MPRFLCSLLSLTLLLLPAAADDAKQATGPNALSAQEQKDGWKLLFDGKSLDGWRAFNKQDSGGWIVRDGTIALEKVRSGDLITKEKYANFEFSIDWKFETGDNSGILYRVTEEAKTAPVSGPEMQVMNHKTTDKLDKNSGGSLYDLYEPKANPFKPADQWNTFKIVCNGKHIEHWVNGVKVVDCDIGSDDWNTRLAASKWKNHKLFASQATGHIALQDHGDKLAFRNVKIKVLPDTK